MNSNSAPLGDFQDIFSTPPTEARYSWVIHGRHETLQGERIHHRHPTVVTEQRTNSFVEGHVDNEQPMEDNLQPASPEIANKRPKTSMSGNELLLDISLETQQEQRSSPYGHNENTNMGRSPPKSQPRVRNLSNVDDREEEEDKENNLEDNLSQADSNMSNCSSSMEEFSTRVFGENYDRTKRYFKSQRVAKMQTDKNQDGSQAATNHHYKTLRLQEELNSATKKINKLNHTNQNALKRKGELQAEVLDVYKKISELEVSRHSLNERHREMTIELKTAKQRVGEAEREAAHAIGCSSKVQRELIDAENKKKKYFSDLNTAEKRIGKLEDLMKELEIECKHECEAKNELQQKLCESETSHKMASNDNKNLENKLGIKEKEMSILERKFERESIEKKQLETRSSELFESNSKLKDELKRLETKYEISQRTSHQYTIKLAAEREKFELATTLKQNAEKESRETKQLLTKEHATKELLNTECTVISEKYKELKKTNDKTSNQNDDLRRENRNLKDRVLYLELYQKISEKKTKPESVVGKNKKKTCFLNTLDEMKTKNRQQKTTRRRSTDSHEDWDQAWDQSQRVQNTWSEGYKRDDTKVVSARAQSDVDRLSEMSAQIEKLQKEQKLINHVSVESCAGSSKATSRVNTARDSDSPVKQDDDDDDDDESINDTSKEIFNDSMPSFYDDDDKTYDVEDNDDEMSGENAVTFSDLLHSNVNRDIANALM